MSAVTDLITEVIAQEIYNELESCYDDEGTPYHPYVPLLAEHVAERVAEALQLREEKRLCLQTDGNFPPITTGPAALASPPRKIPMVRLVSNWRRVEETS